MQPSWRSTLRAARRKLRISLKSVSEDSGLSYETVRGYENGRRNPTRDNLLKVLAALRLTAADTNALLEAAGFAPEPGLYPPDEFPEYAFRVDELQKFLEQRPWPAIATNDAIQVIAANRTMQLLWGLQFKRARRARTPAQMTLFAIIGDYGFLDRVTNWPAFLRAAAALNKGRPSRAAATSPAERLRAIQSMAAGDLKVLKRMQHIWATAKPAPARIQTDFPIVWRDPEFGEMRFRSVVSVASEVDSLDFRDWHPVDAETWRALEKVKSRGLKEVIANPRRPRS